MPPQKTKPTYLGIDNGSSGGIAILDNGRLETIKMPTNEQTMWDTFSQIKERHPRIVAVLEQQIPRPTVFFDPSIGKMKSSILKSTCILYAGYMQTRICLVALDIPFQPTVPETWQKEIGLPHKKQTRSDNKWKNALKQKAQSLFPDHKVTLWNADAILIAEYCRRLHSPSLRRTRAIL